MITIIPRGHLELKYQVLPDLNFGVPVIKF